MGVARRRWPPRKGPASEMPLMRRPAISSRCMPGLFGPALGRAPSWIDTDEWVGACRRRRPAPGRLIASALVREPQAPQSLRGVIMVYPEVCVQGDGAGIRLTCTRPALDHLPRLAALGLARVGLDQRSPPGTGNVGPWKEGRSPHHLIHSSLQSAQVPCLSCHGIAGRPALSPPTPAQL